jgi:hypothetical protein
VFAALVFEYIDVRRVLSNIHNILKVGGRLVSVLQLSPGTEANISSTPFSSVRQLSSLMKLVPPDELRTLAEREHFQFLQQYTAKAFGGKHFEVVTLERQH